MKNFLFLILTLVLLSSCKNENPCKDVICPTGMTCVNGTCEGTISNTVISSNIITNTVWTRDKIYELSGRITVTNGSTLYIEAGTIIKANTGTGSNASALLIARGSQIVAIGTSTLPIIFTSIADDISIEDVSNGNLSSNMSIGNSGLWGGLIVLGNAPISASANEIQIEGIPTTDANGLYGGNNPTDNSGILKYISIRHGGANIGNGNEINGLTLGGVGSGTVVENIEIVGNQDDGIEIFGGSVNVKNILVINSGDDAVDVDQAWSGTLDNFIVICGSATDHALEIDGPEGLLLGDCKIKNGTIKGHYESELADFRACARGRFENLFFFEFFDPSLNGRGDFSLTNPSSSTCTTDNFLNGILVFSNIQSRLPNSVSLNSVFLNGTDYYTTSVSNPTVGGNVQEFIGWTLGSYLNILNF
jgi:hypothetical protein